MEDVIACGERNIGGGLIGILVAFPFIKLIGTLGTVILLLGLIIIFAVLIFGFKPSKFISEFLYDMEERKNNKLEYKNTEKEEKSNKKQIYNVDADISNNIIERKETKKERKIREEEEKRKKSSRS